ncbi:hypothetical protein M514_00777 [Trichuris suis]|uniref:Uncharacterized protein n=1 Tax=Trichuris suis TaxID=68888 RepID=A0A085N9C8_9BILA|nr:hypothetical protein M513_00777 [Trichuris suis]KFD66074.1 hypothetical protein M514_00777 [Trichuris suis]
MKPNRTKSQVLLQVCCTIPSNYLAVCVKTLRSYLRHLIRHSGNCHEMRRWKIKAAVILPP